MAVPTLRILVPAILLCPLVYALVAEEPAKTAKPAATAMPLPEYDAEGKLVRPVGYEKWVVVGTSIGLGYSDGDKKDPDNPGTFHNVYMQPDAFDHYVQTGEFPEQTVLVVTNLKSLPAKTKGPVSRIGFVAAPTSGLEVAIKDSKRFPDGWAYYLFHDTPEQQQNPDHKETATAFPKQECFDCHANHGADDNVFTQFYSVLTDAREKQLAREKVGK